MYFVFSGHVCDSVSVKVRPAMNVYDFDGTIYNGDSTIDFFLYALKRNPSVLRYLPKQVWGFVLYGIKVQFTRDYTG